MPFHLEFALTFLVCSEALRSRIQVGNGTLESRIEDIEKSLRDDPRLEQLRHPGPVLKDQKVASPHCILSADERCPLDDLPRESWSMVFPGGNTTCGDGSPFFFEVWPGDKRRLLVHFEGGGACWNKHTLAMRTCFLSVLRTPGAGFFNSCGQGKIQNPFREFTVVKINYCSGDVHMGHRDTLLSTGKVSQRGYDNAKSAIDWAKANIAIELTNLVITGTSAGGFAVQFWGHVLLHDFRYEHAAVIVDSWQNVGPAGSYIHLLAAWGLCDMLFFKLPTLRPFYTECKKLALDNNFGMMQLMKAYPKVGFAHVVSKYDGIMRYFYDLLTNEFKAAQLADSACGKGGKCGLTSRTTGVTTTGVSAEKFYDMINALTRNFSMHSNYAWYHVASDVHPLSPFVYGDCETPVLSETRREELQRWLAHAVVSNAEALPPSVCEDTEYAGMSGCDESLHSRLFVPSAESRSLASPPALHVMVAAVSVIASALVGRRGR